MKKSVKINWVYYFARKFSLQRFEVVGRVFVSDFFKDHFKVQLKNIMIKPEAGGNHAIWLVDQEYQKAINKIFKVVCRDLKSFHYYKRMIKKVQAAWLKVALKVGKSANSKMSVQDLGKLYEIFIHHHQEHFNKPIWIIFPIEPVLSAKVEKVLKKILARAGQVSDFDYYLKVIFSPEEKNAITAMEEMLLKAAVKIKKTGFDLEAAAKKLAQYYGFIPCYDVIDEPWDVSHFKTELKSVLKKPLSELQSEVAQIKTRFVKHRQEFQKFLRNFELSKDERELFIMAHELVFIKDERDDYRRRGSAAGQNLFNQIGKKFNLNRKEVCYLAIAELRQALKTGLLPITKAQIKERLKGYLLLWKNGRPMIVTSGQEIKHLLNQELRQSQDKQVKEVRGQIGATGLAQGSVVIIYTKHDLRKVYQGAIMVSVTTNPDYVPAMKMCKAFVTDEGGITSHAAIVAREMNKPCIVGAKIASRILKDGDLVEVDANQGVVRKI